ncbi:MAG: aldehyde dehydrogenase [Crocinitomicaceae bacterium]|nr:aldehyde dehydrogenase [Crocinitomicaceae bacterium]|tara:strand:- start:21185 stop:22072 length:888 start_codon:yes stop_codon:yes gene_type:complete
MGRLKVLKTYKLYIGGAFPRTESGRYYQPKAEDEKPMANMCLASRKDFRNSVVAARKAVAGWSGRTAYNRSQILYRIAEMLENNRAHFEEELILQGSSKEEATAEVDASIDRWVYYAGWCDKYTQIFGSVNPVASSHFNFSTLEAMGVVAGICPEDHALLGPTSILAPIIASGNTAIVVASKSRPLSSISLAEVLNNSDVPGGVINILTGDAQELLPHIGAHMDVNAVWYLGNDAAAWKQLQVDAAGNLKRISDINSDKGLMDAGWETPYVLKAFTEVKTTWHPIEVIGASGSGY